MQSVDAYDKDTICVTENTFQRLERGMSVQEIVSILGCLYCLGQIRLYMNLAKRHIFLFCPTRLVCWTKIKFLLTYA